MKKKYDIIVVEWEDSRQSDPNWQWMDDFKPQDICVCKTIGYLIDSTEKALYIAQSITKDNQIAGVITIPKSAVKIQTIMSDIGQYQKKHDIV